MYCQRKFEVEPVEVVYSDGKSYVCPDLSVYDMEVPLSYINGAIGISLESTQVLPLILFFISFFCILVFYWQHTLAHGI